MSNWISLIFTSCALFSREGRKQCQSCNKRQLNDAFYYHCSYNYLYHTKIGQWDMCLGVHTIIGHWNVFFAEENSIDILFRSVKHVVTEEWYILVLSIFIIDTDYRWSWTSEQEFKIGFFFTLERLDHYGSWLVVPLRNMDSYRHLKIIGDGLHDVCLWYLNRERSFWCIIYWDTGRMYFWDIIQRTDYLVTAQD